MPSTPKLSIVYPAEGQEPFTDIMKNYFDTVDSYLYNTIEDRNLMLIDGGNITFSLSTNTLSWTSDFWLKSFVNGYKIIIPAGSISPINDGDIVYVIIPRSLTSDVVVNPVVGQQVGISQNNVVICVRKDNNIYFRNGLKIIGT